MTTTAVANIVRSSTGLTDALFGSIDRLNAKEIDAEHARAISHTAKTIVNIARLELDYRKFAGNDGPDRLKLTSLAMEEKAKS